MESIRPVDTTKTDLSIFTKHLADCVVLTHDNKILMQQRPADWGRFGGFLNIFGGHVENGETVMQTLIRELNEELGARVDEKDVVFIGAISEDFTNHTELVHVHFWHDKNNMITGCYEAEAVCYETVENVLKHSKIMDYAVWALSECKNRRLLK